MACQGGDPLGFGTPHAWMSWCSEWRYWKIALCDPRLVQTRSANFRGGLRVVAALFPLRITYASSECWGLRQGEEYSGLRRIPDLPGVRVSCSLACALSRTAVRVEVNSD